MKSSKLCLLLIAISSASANICFGGLSLVIADAGGGNTVWTWDGSDTATLSGFLETGTFIQWGRGSSNDITTVNNLSALASAGGGTISNTTTATSAMFSTTLVDDEPGPKDQLGFIAPGAGNPMLSWMNGDVISLSGIMTVPISITDLDESALPFSGIFATSETFCGLAGSCGLPILNVAIVPEPSATMLLGVSALLVGGVRIRRFVFGRAKGCQGDN